MPYRHPIIQRVLNRTRSVKFEVPPAESVLPSYLSPGPNSMGLLVPDTKFAQRTFNSRPCSLKLSLELLRLICLWLDFESLRSVTRASQLWWRVACPLLWEKCDELELLIHMMIGTTLPLDLSSNHNPDNTTESRSRGLVSTED